MTICVRKKRTQHFVLIYTKQKQGTIWHLQKNDKTIPFSLKYCREKVTL